jgi:hypothetical protein
LPKLVFPKRRPGRPTLEEAEERKRLELEYETLRFELGE